MNRFNTGTLSLLLTLLLTGCASRYDQLRAKAGRVESSLVAERDRQSASDAADRDARLSHLSNLRATLSAANVGLGSTRFIPKEQRDVAFDILDEVYGTIEWNIPLGPADTKKPLPSTFNSDGTLRLTNQPLHLFLLHTFLLILRPTRLEMLTLGPTDAERDAIAAHFAYLSTLHANGSLSLAGRTANNDPRTLGIALLRAPDESSARALVAADPCVARGVMTAELLPFRVAIPSGNA